MDERYYACGAVGPFIDERPIISHANIKPYIIAILLHRGAVSFVEVLTCVSPHCADIDTKIGLWDGLENYQIEDRSRLEILVEEVLAEMVSSHVLRYNNEQGLWVLSAGRNHRNVPTIINWVAATGAQMPHHIVLEMSQDEIVRSNRVSSHD